VAAGALPLNFFYTVPAAQNFFGNSRRSYDITTPAGFKASGCASNTTLAAADLYNSGTPRFIQFGIKLYF